MLQDFYLKMFNPPMLQPVGDMELDEDELILASYIWKMCNLTLAEKWEDYKNTSFFYDTKIRKTPFLFALCMRFRERSGFNGNPEKKNRYRGYSLN